MSDEKYESLLRMYNDSKRMIAEKNELYGTAVQRIHELSTELNVMMTKYRVLNAKYDHLSRKAAHGCTDMSCIGCDGTESEARHE